MLAKLKAHVLEIGTILYATFMPYLNTKYGLQMTNNYMHGVQALCLMLLGKLWHTGIIQAKADALFGPKPATQTDVAAPATKVPSFLLPLLALFGLSMGGCAGMSQLSDADLAAWTQSTTATEVQAGLTVLAAVEPTRLDAIKADCEVVKQVINGPVLALFNSPTAQVTASTLNTAAQLLKAKIAGIKNGPLIVATTQSALILILNQLQLPQLPTATVSARQKGALIGFFTGIAQGIDGFSAVPK